MEAKKVSRAIRIESDGRPGGTHVYDVETGQSFKNVIGVDFAHEGGFDAPDVRLSVMGTELVLESEEFEVVPCDIEGHPLGDGHDNAVRDAARVAFKRVAEQRANPLVNGALRTVEVSAVDLDDLLQHVGTLLGFKR